MISLLGYGKVIKRQENEGWKKKKQKTRQTTTKVPGR